MGLRSKIKQQKADKLAMQRFEQGTQADLEGMDRGVPSHAEQIELVEEGQPRLIETAIPKVQQDSSLAESSDSGSLVSREVIDKDPTGVKHEMLVNAIQTAQINFIESRDGRNVFQGSLFAKKDTNRANNFKLNDGTVIGLDKVADDVTFDQLVTAVQDYLDSSNHITAGKHFAHNLMVEIDPLLDMTTDVSNNESSQDRLGSDGLAHPNKNGEEFLGKFKFWVDHFDAAKAEKVAMMSQEKPLPLLSESTPPSLLGPPQKLSSNVSRSLSLSDLAAEQELSSDAGRSRSLSFGSR